MFEHRVNVWRLLGGLGSARHAFSSRQNLKMPNVAEFWVFEARLFTGPP